VQPFSAPEIVVLAVVELGVVFRARNVLSRTLLATGVLSFQEPTGANFFFYYGTSILRRA
jgi:hypothetical protein